MVVVLSSRSGTKGTNVSLVDCFPQVLNVLHQVNCTVSQAFCDLAVGEDTNELQDRLVFSCGRI